MPKAERVPGDDGSGGLTAEQQIERRVEDEVEKRLAAAVQAGVRAAMRDQQTSTNLLGPRIQEDPTLPTSKGVDANELSRPKLYREGWLVPPNWPPNPEVARAEASAKVQADVLGEVVRDALAAKG